MTLRFFYFARDACLGTDGALYIVAQMEKRRYALKKGLEGVEINKFAH